MRLVEQPKVGLGAAPGLAPPSSPAPALASPRTAKAAGTSSAMVDTVVDGDGEDFCRFHLESLERLIVAGDRAGAERHVSTLVSRARETEERVKSLEKALHIGEVRLETAALQAADRALQLKKSNENGRKNEQHFRKACKQQEDATRRMEAQFTESELRHARRHDQELKLRFDLEERVESLKAIERQLRERLQAERRAREASEERQRTMLQRHLQKYKALPAPPTPTLNPLEGWPAADDATAAGTAGTERWCGRI